MNMSLVLCTWCYFEEDSVTRGSLGMSSLRWQTDMKPNSLPLGPLAS